MNERYREECCFVVAVVFIVVVAFVVVITGEISMSIHKEPSENKVRFCNGEANLAKLIKDFWVVLKEIEIEPFFDRLQLRNTTAKF